MILRIAGILKTVSGIVLVQEGYEGGSSPLSSRFELDAKYEAKASALSEASMATELSGRLRGGNDAEVKFLFIYLLRDQNWFEPLGQAASLSAFFWMKDFIALPIVFLQWARAFMRMARLLSD